jgi:hypothetical protein
MFKTRQDFTYTDKHMEAIDKRFHSEARQKVRSHRVVVGRVLAKEDWAFLWKSHQGRLCCSKHSRECDNNKGTEMTLNIHLHCRVRAADIQKDDSNQNTQKDCKTKAGFKSGRVTDQIVHFASEKEFHLSNHSWWFVTIVRIISSFHGTFPDGDTKSVLSLLVFKGVTHITRVYQIGQDIGSKSRGEINIQLVNRISISFSISDGTTYLWGTDQQHPTHP